jgi:hypothetical protein
MADTFCFRRVYVTFADINAEEGKATEKELKEKGLK